MNENWKIIHFALHGLLCVYSAIYNETHCMQIWHTLPSIAWRHANITSISSSDHVMKSLHLYSKKNVKACSASWTHTLSYRLFDWRVNVKSVACRNISDPSHKPQKWTYTAAHPHSLAADDPSCVLQIRRYAARKRDDMEIRHPTINLPCGLIPVGLHSRPPLICLWFRTLSQQWKTPVRRQPLSIGSRRKWSTFVITTISSPVRRQQFVLQLRGTRTI